MFSYCDVDFQDNVYDSERQDVAGWVSIWNSTLFGTQRIAKIVKGYPVPSFSEINAADHASCYGGN